MAENGFKLIILGIIAGGAAVHTYNVSGLLPSIGVFLTLSWLLIHLKTKIEVWEALGTLLDPFRTAVTFLLLGFTYGALQGYGLGGSVFAGLAGSIIGGIFSMFIYKYWNIGA